MEEEEEEMLCEQQNQGSIPHSGHSSSLQVLSTKTNHQHSNHGGGFSYVAGVVGIIVVAMGL